METVCGVFLSYSFGVRHVIDCLLVDDVPKKTISSETGLLCLAAPKKVNLSSETFTAFVT